METKEELRNYELKVVKRAKNNDYVNLYIYIDGYRFELVPHTRSVKETAFYYSLLKNSKLMSAE